MIGGSDKYTPLRKKYRETYIIWKGIRGRCYCKGNSSYYRYGGKGIKMCKRWRETPEGFKNFLDDMGPRPEGKYSIERLDNTKGYSPDNCKWATDIEQANNKNNSAKYTYNGKTRTITEWGREYGINEHTIHHRWDRGVRGEKLFYKGDLRAFRNKPFPN